MRITNEKVEKKAIIIMWILFGISVITFFIYGYFQTQILDKIAESEIDIYHITSLLSIDFDSILEKIRGMSFALLIGIPVWFFAFRDVDIVSDILGFIFYIIGPTILIIFMMVLITKTIMIYALVINGGGL